MARRLTLDFLKTETAGGAVLALAAVLGMVAANTRWADGYFGALEAEIPVQIGAWSQTLSGLDWIKEGLMTLFFFVVGLEIKYEIVKGELSSPRRLALPVIAAAGGMLAPALVYVAVTGAAGAGEALHGWPVPTATDIAFALAALSLAGRRAPPALRTFLMALAVADDLGAVVLIAALFTRDLDFAALALALCVVCFLAVLGRWRRAPASLFVAAAAVLWALTLESGVSPSVAGVAAALCVPVRPRRDGERGVLERVSEALHPYVAWGVLPLFAFAATGFRIGGLSAREAFGPVPLAVALALLVGKPAGVLGASWLAVRLKLARRPTGVGWGEMAAAAALCGVGFTMSLYLGALAFEARPDLAAESRIGVLAGSLLSTAAGLLLLSRLRRPVDEERPDARTRPTV